MLTRLHVTPRLRMASVTLLALITIVQPRIWGAEPEELPLWDGDIPGPAVMVTDPEMDLPAGPGQRPIRRRTNITRPTLMVYPAAADTHNGAAIIVIPGGGFRYLTVDLEGSEACERWQQLGVTCFVLKHRCPTHEHTDPSVGPVIDAQQAVRVVRAQADKWKLNPEKIGVLGFSAGGQVALLAATKSAQEVISIAIEPPPHRPNLLLMAYPWGLYLPKDGQLRADIQITDRTPPTFIAQAADDTASLPQGSSLVFHQLLQAKVPAELHIYERGGHGFGVRETAEASTTDWHEQATRWLSQRQFLTLPGK
jgi:acetyl esterase/lipase